MFLILGCIILFIIAIFAYNYLTKKVEDDWDEWGKDSEPVFTHPVVIKETVVDNTKPPTPTYHEKHGLPTRHPATTVKPSATYQESKPPTTSTYDDPLPTILATQLLLHDTYAGPDHKASEATYGYSSRDDSQSTSSYSSSDSSSSSSYDSGSSSSDSGSSSSSDF